MKMNLYEKMVMLLVPTLGVTAIVYFLFFYLPDVQNGQFYDTSRLQGPTQYMANNNKVNSKAVSRYGSNITNHTTKYKIAHTTPRKQYMTDYLKWSDEESVTFMPQSLKNKRYKQTHSTFKQVKNHQIINHNIHNQTPKQIIKKSVENKTNKISSKLCDHYLKQKEYIESRMRAGYKPREYNHLEGQRKYWAKKYADNCF